MSKSERKKRIEKRIEELSERINSLSRHSPIYADSRDRLLLRIQILRDQAAIEQDDETI